MAENKKSFLIYCDLLSTVEKMPDDKAGLLFKHLLRYVNDQNPVTDDLIIELTFEHIKLQMKRDLKKYESVCDRNRNNGALGGRPSKTQKTQWVNLGLKNNPKEPKQPDTDTDTDTDTIIYKKENITEFVLDDLENSTHLEIICKRTELTLSRIKELIPEFKKAASLEYKTVLDLINHFIRWVNKNKNIIIIEKPYDPEAEKKARIEAARIYNEKTNPANL